MASATDSVPPPTSPVCSRTLKAPGRPSTAQQQTQILDSSGGAVPKLDRDSRPAWLPQLLSLQQPKQPHRYLILNCSSSYEQLFTARIQSREVVTLVREAGKNVKENEHNFTQTYFFHIHCQSSQGSYRQKPAHSCSTPEAHWMLRCACEQPLQPSKTEPTARQDCSLPLRLPPGFSLSEATRLAKPAALITAQARRRARNATALATH